MRKNDAKNWVGSKKYRADFQDRRLQTFRVVLRIRHDGYADYSEIDIDRARKHPGLFHLIEDAANGEGIQGCEAVVRVVILVQREGSVVTKFIVPQQILRSRPHFASAEDEKTSGEKTRLLSYYTFIGVFFGAKRQVFR